MEERETLQLIDERDEAENAVSAIYEAAMGRSAEWSSLWDFNDAVNEVAEYVDSLGGEHKALKQLLGRWLANPKCDPELSRDTTLVNETRDLLIALSFKTNVTNSEA